MPDVLSFIFGVVVTWAIMSIPTEPVPEGDSDSDSEPDDE